MTQIATVTNLGADGLVEVTVARQTACGHDCENCAGCGAQAGAVAVEEGDRVEIYSSRKVLAVAALVYLVPVILFLAGYALTPGFSEVLRYICGGVGFTLGLVMAVAYDRAMRREKTITYHIIQKL